MSEKFATVSPYCPKHGNASMFSNGRTDTPHCIICGRHGKDLVRPKPFVRAGLPVEEVRRAKDLARTVWDEGSCDDSDI